MSQPDHPLPPRRPNKPGRAHPADEDSESTLIEPESVLDPEMIRLTKQIAPRASSFAPLEILGLGWVVVLSLVGGIAGGIWLDGRFGTGPLLTIVGLAMGLALAVIAARSLIRRATAK